MATLLERVQLLCDQKGIKIYRLEKDLNMAGSTIRKWDSVSPTCRVISQVADYFDVSIDYLLGRTQNEFSHREFLPRSSIIILKQAEKLNLTEGEAIISAQVIAAVAKGCRQNKVVE